MSSNIDILVGIDAQTILTKYSNPSTNPDAPTGIDNNLVYMIVKQGSAVSGNGEGELDVGASIGDSIRWRESSLSVNFEYSVTFYNFTSSGGENVITLPPLLVGGVQDDGSLSKVMQEMPKHSSDTPPWLPPSMQNVPYHFWQSTVQGTGKVTYHWQFSIADRHGTIKGYFQWDPYITVKD